ncbi:uncharacterized protein LOC130700781 isoform X1 [Daphnia carinata]|uniref:uncharacterized protein LOC130700781 isoform X1 n=1 Tax=Daphnia carinata TaxID=120202 RepID=UPI00257E339F|nr:uncharacterized protein LOC130700781 isoform X1 [Daphnia carinata]
MSRSNSASMSSLSMMVIACFLVLASAEERSSVVDLDRQSKQILLTPESYHFPSSPLPYFNPYGQPLMVAVDVFPDPNAVPYVYSPSSSGNLGMERAFQNQLADIKITPTTTECLLSDITIDGSVRCRQASQARRGNIYIKFSAGDQIANFAITAPTNFNIRLTCSEKSDNINAFTQSVRISKTSDTPVTESNYMNIAVYNPISDAGRSRPTMFAAVRVTADGVLKCSWESSRQ